LFRRWAGNAAWRGRAAAADAPQRSRSVVMPLSSDTECIRWNLLYISRMPATTDDLRAQANAYYEQAKSAHNSTQSLLLLLRATECENQADAIALTARAVPTKA
jgi:hypothetical protein